MEILTNRKTRILALLAAAASIGVGLQYSSDHPSVDARSRGRGRVYADLPSHSELRAALVEIESLRGQSFENVETSHVEPTSSRFALLRSLFVWCGARKTRRCEDDIVRFHEILSTSSSNDEQLRQRLDDTAIRTLLRIRGETPLPRAREPVSCTNTPDLLA